MKNLFASILSFIGGGVANTGSQACWMLWMDEPDCPKSLIK